MGPRTLQTWDPMLCLSSQLWWRMYGQPLLQRCVASHTEKDSVRKKFITACFFIPKVKVPTVHKREPRKTTSLSQRPPVLPSHGHAPLNLHLPVSPPQPPPSPPQWTSRRMKWSTHSRCVSCHLTVYSGSGFISKWGVFGMVSRWEGQRGQCVL